MAFFKFRKGGGEAATATAQPESVEALRKRARQRLIGAAILVMLGVIGFPLVFDTQPRPIAVDIPIDIPDRNKAVAAPVPAAPAASGAIAHAAGPEPVPAAAAPAASSAAPSAPAAAPAFVQVAPAPAVATPAQPAPAVPAAAPAASTPAAPAVAKAPLASAAKAAASRPARAASAPASAARKASTPTDGDRAKALLEGRPASAAANGRYVIQVGAYADTDKVASVRSKLEKAGIRTYTQVADTKEGKRTRVRVGPFATRAEADKAADKVKSLGLPVSMLSL